MLIERIRDAYRDLINPVVTDETFTTVEAKRPAANESSYAFDEMQARRHRRQRRINRAAANRISGWAVSSW